MPKRPSRAEDSPKKQTDGSLSIAWRAHQSAFGLNWPLVERGCYPENNPAKAVHKGAFCQFPFRWIYYYGRTKSTEKEIGKTHLSAV